MTALALVARWRLDPVLGNESPFLTVFAALLILVLVVQPGPFLVAAVVSVLGTLVLFIEPRLTFETAGPTEFVSVASFGLAAGAAAIAAWLSQRTQVARRRAEAAYVRRGEELRLITDAVPARISYIDTECRYRFINEAYVDWFGRPPADILGHEVREILGNEAFARVQPYIESALAGDRSQFEGPGAPYKDGSPRQIIADFVPDLRADGSVAGFYALITDITAQHLAETEHARLAAIIETSGDAIMSISFAGQILTWNRGAERLFGHSAQEAVGQSLDLILPPARAHEERAILEPARSGELVGPYDTVRCTKDRRLIDVSVSASPIRDPLGRIIGISKVDRGITERKLAERALSESERRLATLVSNLPGVAYRRRNEPNWPMEFISEGVYELLGHGSDEFLSGRVSWAQFTHPEDVERVWAAVEAAVGERRAYRLEYRVVHRDGSERWVWEQGEAVFDDTGSAAAHEGFVADLTQRKRAEQLLETARARERSYLEHLPVGVWFANERGEFTYGNAAARRIWGANLIGRPDRRAKHYEAYWHDTKRRIAPDDWALARVFRLGQTSLGEVIDLRGVGEPKTILNSAVPVRDVDGNVVGAVVMNLDVTEQKRAEQALKDADRRKDEFLATLAHELRNPLAAIRSAADLLVRSPLHHREQRDRVTEIIQRQVLLMVRLMDDLLDVSRITHGTLELRIEPTSLRSLVDQAIDAARPSIDAKQQTLEVHAPSEQIEVQGDAVRLVQVFINILGNACKYTDSGGHIEVRITRESEDAVVDIRDDGIGIPPDKLDTIFEMFSQLDLPGRGKAGVGIGLALTRRLVEMHGGRVSAISEGLHRGSTVRVRLPAIPSATVREQSPPVAAGELESPAGLGRRVLVVDDNVDAADCLEMLLAIRGHQARTAYDGTSALAEAEAFRPEVILLDLGLPDIGGLDVCKALRVEAWAEQTLIIALSGWGQDEDKRRTAAAGFDAHLTKPADFDEVMTLIAERMPARSG